MTIKNFIKLFVPPIYYRIKVKIKYGSPFFVDITNKADYVYEAIKSINERHSLKLTDIEHLSEEPQYRGACQIALGDIESTYYGSFYTLQKYANIPFRNFPPKHLNIQHGFISDILRWEQHKMKNINWVWSLYVKKMYAEYTSNPNIIVIGAPFFYANSILSKEEIEEEKKRLGRNLLAFPSHSTPFANCSYDFSAFIKLLNEYKKQFDTVRVCVYWADYVRGFAKPYIDAGFECVSCGHMGDPFFLERQKALFEIADATISNSIGSHVGYSIYMNKPHILVADEVEWENFVDRCTEVEESKNIKAHSTNYREIFNAFYGQKEFVITEEQRQVVDKYWGASSMISPEEMRALLNDAYKLSENYDK